MRNRIVKGIVIFCLIMSFLFESSIVIAQSTSKNGTVKTSYGEYIFENGYVTAVRRNQYGVLAEGIEECKVTSGAYGDSILVKKQGKNNCVYEIGLKYKSFPNYLISKRAAEFYPLDSARIILKDKVGKLRYIGEGHCFFIYNHKTEKQCDKSSKLYKEERVLRGVKKVWSDTGGIAYVKNNTLYFAYSKSMVAGCYDFESAGIHKYFAGKGNQVKKVVSPYYEGPVFVLMKDGSIWGMGDNSKHLITNDSIEYFEEFQKLEINGVKDVDTNAINVAVLKKDNTLWVWGKSLKNEKKYTARLQKISGNVKEISVGTSTEGKDRTVILFKKNGNAYGFGANKGYVSYMLTDKYKKKWISKPVLLMKDVKHIYAGCDITLILNKRRELLWTGFFTCANLYT